MPTSCSAYGCTNNVCKDDCKARGVSFFRYPLKNKKLLLQWLKKIRRKDFKPTKSSRICSDHFKPECFFYLPGQGTIQVRQLVKGAVPTIFCFTKNNPSSSSINGTDHLFIENTEPNTSSIYIDDASTLALTEESDNTNAEELRLNENNAKLVTESVLDMFASSIGVAVMQNHRTEGQHSSQIVRMRPEKPPTIIFCSVKPQTSTETEENTNGNTYATGTSVDHETTLEPASRSMKPISKPITVDTEVQTDLGFGLVIDMLFETRKERDELKSRMEGRFAPEVMSSEQISAFTGFKKETFFKIFNMLDMAPKLRHQKLPPVKQFLLFLMRLKTGLPLEILAYIFEISATTVHHIVQNMMDIIYMRFRTSIPNLLPEDRIVTEYSTFIIWIQKMLAREKISDAQFE